MRSFGPVRTTPKAKRQERQLIEQTRKLLLAAFGAVAGFVAGLSAASAQELSTAGGYRFFITPICGSRAFMPRL